MADTFLLHLVTPARSIFSGPVEELVACGVLGEFCVLPGHANMLAGLTLGRISYRNSDGEKKLVASGGFAEVSREHVTMLLDDALYVDELDSSLLDREIAEIEAAPAQEGDPGFAAWQSKAAWKRYCREQAG